MSLRAYPAAAPQPYANLTISTAHAEYPTPYHSAGLVPSAFAGGSSLAADHLAQPQWSPRYFHARGTQLGQQSAAPPRYSSTSSSATAPARYATGVPISGYGAIPSFSGLRPEGPGRAWGRDTPASADDVQGLAVHGHASEEALLPLRYPAAAAASLVVAPSSRSSGSGSGQYKSGEGVVLASPTPQVPLPSQMAILLNNAGGRREQPDAYGDGGHRTAHDGTPHNLPPPPAHVVMFPNMIHSQPATEAELEEDADAIEEGYLSREKKHGCTMCHKRFDRPSTLKKVRVRLLRLRARL
ncbi:hypothetical protein DFH07DRAFT_825764 [Mycena maculata]|uniref:Uncharacterized protein n=1 Tax=Mycena maculata TaxID=230809 RepID=A0AAD7IW94_9AGAR|nr:hypothetical protein DFH07DRAFT_825764 [Mycena maculata]